MLRFRVIILLVLGLLVAGGLQAADDGTELFGKIDFLDVHNTVVVLAVVFEVVDPFVEGVLGDVVVGFLAQQPFDGPVETYQRAVTVHRNLNFLQSYVVFARVACGMTCMGKW